MAAAAPGPLLCLAGEPEVRIDGATFALGTREAALLAWLAIEGPTSRADLAILLWPESNADAARAALRQRIFQLRRIAGTALVVGTQTISLAAGVRHDLEDGDAVLGERDAAVGASFDAWLDRQRSERKQRVHRLLVERVDRAEAAGELAEATRYARELLAREPLSEVAHRRLIRLLYLAGERPAALLAFDRCEQQLKDEVGVAPSPETLALLQTILRAETAAAGDGPAREAVPAAVLRPPLRVGRAGAWNVLATPRSDGPQRVRIVLGEPGMGKSRLLADVVQAANVGAPAVVLATARPGDTRVPYALAARLLRGVLAAHDLRLSSGQVVRLVRILPEVGAGTAPGLTGSRAGLVDASTELLESAAALGLAGVVVDDLQFADDASVEWLQALVGAGTKLDWTLAMRPHELRAPARAWIDSLQAEAAVDTLTLEPLSKADVGRLLGSLGVPGLDVAADRIDALQQLTGGNPLYVLETVKAMLAERPARPTGGDPGAAPWPAAPNVVRLIQQRLRRLSPLARSVARCAAIAGQDHDVRLTAQVLGKPVLELSDAWLELEAAQVLRADGQFAHDLIADAATASVPPAIRAPLHADIARWLEAHGGEPGRLAEHWLAAGMPTAAAPWLFAAGERALATFRPDEAAPRFQQASTIYAAAGERRRAFEALFQAAGATVQHGYGKGNQPMHEALLDLADDEGQLAMATLFLVGSLIEQLRFDEAIETARRAAAQAGAAGLADIEAELRFGLAVIHWEKRQLDDAAREARRVIELLRDLPVERRLLKATATDRHANYVLGLMLSASGRYDEGELRFTEVRRLASRAGDVLTARIVDNAMAGFTLDRGDVVRALSLSSAAMATIEQRALADNGVVMIMARHAHLLSLHGQLGRALDVHERAAEIYGQMATRHLAPAVQRALFQYRLGRRDLASAGLAETRRRLQPDATTVWLALRAARLQIGEDEDAAAVLAAAAGNEDAGTRVGAVCLAALRCDAVVALPVLDAELAKATARGAKGMALALVARRAAVLHAAGRVDDAGAAALAAWQSVEAGICCHDLMLPDLAALLYPPLANVRPELARTIAARGRQWMKDAAATLPESWRDNYLARAPALAGLGAAGVVVA